LNFLAKDFDAVLKFMNAEMQKKNSDYKFRKHRNNF